MHSDNLHLWQHSHTFGQDLKRPGELRTLISPSRLANARIPHAPKLLSIGKLLLVMDNRCWTKRFHRRSALLEQSVLCNFLIDGRLITNVRQ